MFHVRRYVYTCACKIGSRINFEGHPVSSWHAAAAGAAAGAAAVDYIAVYHVAAAYSSLCFYTYKYTCMHACMRACTLDI